MPVRADHSERLALVELLLVWEGRATRTRLRQLTGLQTAQASRLLAAYRNLAPQNCEHDTAARGLVATPTIRPVVTAGRFLEYQRMLDRAPEDAAPALVRVASVDSALFEIAPHLFRPAHQAIELGCALELTYLDAGHPKGRIQTVFPHALIAAPGRWLMRAYLEQDGVHGEISLARITHARFDRSRPADPTIADRDWERIETVRLVPHPALPPGEQTLLRADFMAGTAALVLSQRAPVIPYLLDALMAAREPTREPPPRFRLCVYDAARSRA